MTAPRRLVTAETDRTCPAWCDPKACTIYIAGAGGCHQSNPVFVLDDAGQPRASVFLRQFPHGQLQVAWAVRGDSLPPACAARFAAALDEVAGWTGVRRAG